MDLTVQLAQMLGLVLAPVTEVGQVLDLVKDLEAAVKLATILQKLFKEQLTQAMLKQVVLIKLITLVF